MKSTGQYWFLLTLYLFRLWVIESQNPGLVAFVFFTYEYCKFVAKLPPRGLLDCLHTSTGSGPPNFYRKPGYWIVYILLMELGLQIVMVGLFLSVIYLLSLWVLESQVIPRILVGVWFGLRTSTGSGGKLLVGP